MMKLSILLMVAGTLAVSAESYSQGTKLSLNLNDVTIKQVFDAIEQNSEFIILYSDDIVDVSEQVSVDVRDASVEQILDQVFAGSKVGYEINDRQIVITRKTGMERPEVVRQPGNQVTGKVVDQKQQPLPGVSVAVKGTTTGTITDFNGSFRLVIPEGGTVLQFSFVGFQPQEVTIGTEKTFSITLQEDVMELEEIVAVGYGVQRKSDLTGATSRLTEDNMNKSVATSPVEMMQGRVSGVNITQNNGEPGAGMSVRIRGTNSIRSGQEPLYVIDGVPLDNSNLTPTGGSAAGYGSGASKNPISFLNPEDVESMDVLKDASSTAIYGARGANGVVLITTKKGKQGRSSITYDGYTGISQIREKMDLLSAEEFRSYTKADGSKLLDLGASVDWQDEVFTTGITQSHSLSYSGGTENFTYHASMGYLNQGGIVESTGQEKLNGKINVSQKAFDGKLNVTASLIASHITDDRAPITEASGAGYEGDLILTVLKTNPTYPIYNEDGSYYQHANDQRNAVAMIDLVDDETQTDRIISNLSAEYEILKNLKYKINLGFDRTSAERRVNQNKELSYLVNKGEADINNITANNRLVENYVTYQRDINEDHSLNFLAGHAYQFFKISTSEMNVNGFEVDDIKYTDNLGYGNFSAASVASTAVERELQSFFGRVNYNFRDKYMLTFTGRFDGSSKFGENNKYGFFPSAAFAWRLTGEEFMEDMKAISNLKLRLGWGLTGNQEIPDKISLLAVGTTPSANGYFGGKLTPGITYLRTPNPDIQWETTMQTNIGIDFGFFENRLSGTIDLFNKKTTDVLLEVYGKFPSPTERQWQNVEDMKIINNGIELGLNGTLIAKKELSWDLGFNFSYIKNEVKDMPVQLIETGNASGQGLSDTRVQIITNGEPMGTFYGLVWEGFDENGMSMYKTDSDGNQVKEYLGSALPDYTYSISSKLTWKRFDASMFWYGSHGNEVYNNTANALFLKGPLDKGNNVTKEVLNSVENPENSNAFSSRFIEDGSFLRLSNVTIGYTFDTEAIKWLNSARLYVTGNNLLLFTDYSGYDPEVNVAADQRGVPSMGIDFSSYPKARTFTFGVNLQF